ncbi:MAG: response regulator [Lentisphaerae bacterium]|nr:response regulator [Lentisphaerota bacterium]
MPKKSEASDTMRIDIHPDFLTESLERKRIEYLRASQSGQSVADSESNRMGHESKYRNLLQSIYDGVLITDSFGKIVDYNLRAVDFFLCGGGELLSMNILNLISGADSSLLNAIGANLENHRYTLIEAHCVRKDGSMFASEIAVNNIDLNGTECMCFFVRDVTVRKRAQDALEEAVAQLSEHDRARSQFVSNVSHELRTPLTSMTYAVANMLRGVLGELPDKVRQYLLMLDSDCKRMLGTVNDILDLRKIENKSLKLARTRIPFVRLVQRAVESFRVQAERKHIALAVNMGTKNWFVDCDPHKMERVAINIVGNSMKFTPDGGSINVSFDENPQEPGFVALCVEDSGIGIPPEAIAKVTERYFTVGEQSCGSGLGLAICKEVVELHGGTISITSPPLGKDKGTSVCVHMPTSEAPLLLIADDEEGIVQLLTNQLRNHGYRTLSAFDGQETLKMIKIHKPDLVLLDLVLPDIEGTEVILKMKSDKDIMRIPTIVITAAHLGRAKAEILRSFAIPALAKPWNESELLDSVEGAFLGVTSLAGGS